MNSSSKQKRVTLYFTDGPKLTAEDHEAMEKMPNPRHRNARFIEPGDKLEECTFVAGPAIPEQYRHIDGPPVLVEKADANGNGEADDDEFDPHNANVAQLKTALDELGIGYAATAKKADLVLLYEQSAAK